MNLLRAAALAGVGAALLPGMVVADDIAAGRLRVMLPEWQAQAGVIQAVFPSRRGLIPAVRSLIDFLVAAFEADPRSARPTVSAGNDPARASAAAQVRP